MFHTKTDAGRQEIRSRRMGLSRAARNLLLIIDPARPTEQWLQMVHGATADDVVALVAAGLIVGVDDEAEQPAQPQGVPAASASPAGPADASQPVLAALQDIVQNPLSAAPAPTLATLSQRYTAVASRYLSLIESYRFILEVERCASVGDLQQLAPRLIAAIARQQGPELAERLRQEFGLPASAAR